MKITSSEALKLLEAQGGKTSKGSDKKGYAGETMELPVTQSNYQKIAEALDLQGAAATDAIQVLNALRSLYHAEIQGGRAIVHINSFKTYHMGR